MTYTIKQQITRDLKGLDVCDEGNSHVQECPLDSMSEALTTALVLALTAPTEAQAFKAVALAETLARSLTKAQLECAKSNALRQVA